MKSSLPCINDKLLTCPKNTRVIQFPIRSKVDELGEIFAPSLIAFLLFQMGCGDARIRHDAAFGKSTQDVSLAFFVAFSFVTLRSCSYSSSSLTSSNANGGPNRSSRQARNSILSPRLMQPESISASIKSIERRNGISCGKMARENARSAGRIRTSTGGGMGL